MAIVLGVSFCGISGCAGCRSESGGGSEAEKQKKLEEKKKENFEVGRPTQLPGDGETALCWYKPGHWTSLSIPAKANNFDLVGRMQIDLADRDGGTIALEGMPYSLVESRDAALPKGQDKELQATLFVPVNPKPVHASLKITGRGGRYFETAWPLSRMPSYQYHFAVLADTPDRYVFLRKLHAVKPPRDAFESRLDGNHYRVVLLKPGRNVQLPAQAMFWTSIAYLLWDDADPQTLSPDQQQALLDWLHWGGQLIVSGPATLDALRGSFLADYLPAAAAGNWDFQAADFDELNSRYTLPGQGKLSPAGKWSGVKLALGRHARFLPGTGKLFAERRVGRGRIVVSAMRLCDRDLTTWAGFDGLFNACLLRREPRKYISNEFGDTELVWAAPGANPFDAARITALRYFSRDCGLRLEDYGLDAVRPKTETDEMSLSYNPSSPGPPYTADAVPPADEIAAPGVAAWRNFSPVASFAREALRNAARVEIPGRMFVIWVVGLYLLVLVPLNWSVFAALGRVEWAWAAAPAIAIACTLAVIRFAQLDIGFARSAAELSVVELQDELPRAHVTRYTALYTSLTTAYTARHDDPGTAVQPFPSKIERAEDFRMFPGQGIETLHYDHAADVTLRGFTVASNTTGLMHGEQMAALEGPLMLRRGSGGNDSLLNHTGLELRGAGVIRRDENGRLHAAWIGDLYRSASASLNFRPIDENDLKPQTAETADGEPIRSGLWVEERELDAVTRSEPVKGEFNLRNLLRLAEDHRELQPGDYRLVAWTDQSIPGVEIEPAAPQSRAAAVVIANLHYGFGPDPRPDVNTNRNADRN